MSWRSGLQTGCAMKPNREIVKNIDEGKQLYSRRRALSSLITRFLLDSAVQSRVPARMQRGSEGQRASSQSPCEYVVLSPRPLRRGS